MVRPVINVYEVELPTEGKVKLEEKVVDSVKCAGVFSAPLRFDIVEKVHDLMRKNTRQPYAVSNRAGHNTSAASWGTGRAVARIPRVRGSGTSRSGQGAYGNMCRGGHMFAPTQQYRKWLHRVPIKQRRVAVCAAIAATAQSCLVMARGHIVDNVPEVPLVMSDKYESLKKTKDAMRVMKGLGLWDDVEKVKSSRTLRAGIGKMRNRRYVQKKGPVVVYHSDNGIVNAFRNVPGVTLMCAKYMNLLELAPGGQLGRLAVYTKSAVEFLEKKYGNQDKSSEVIKNFVLPKPMMKNDDFQAILNSEAVQNVLKPRNLKAQMKTSKVKKNPLKNKGVMAKLNPFAAGLKKINKRIHEENVAKKTMKTTA